MFERTTRQRSGDFTHIIIVERYPNKTPNLLDYNFLETSHGLFIYEIFRTGHIDKNLPTTSKSLPLGFPFLRDPLILVEPVFVCGTLTV